MSLCSSERARMKRCMGNRQRIRRTICQNDGRARLLRNSGCPVEKQNLESICRYRNEAVFARNAKCEEYISTESMVANRGGITPASSAPSDGKAKRYRKDDVLVSNIRPYFKKIWHASHDGACSNDVLVFEATKCDPSYLFWVLSSDAFFDYMMKTAKGTKMPRGDKKAIMGYQVGLPPVDQQKAICEILESLQEKIALNNQLNGYLLELATALFERALTESCTEVLLDDIVDLEDSKRIPLNSRDRAQRKGPYPYYGATSVMDYVDDYLFDGIRVLLGEDGTVIRDDGRPVLQYVWGKYWVNNHAHILKASSIYSIEAIYTALSRTAINRIVTGAVQMKISQRNLKSLQLSMPDPDAIHDLGILFGMYRQNADENRSLEKLRGYLLPRLMSGEIDVSEVELPTQLNSHLADC